MKTIVCPQCKKDDKIQKLSSIYDSGISTGYFSGFPGDSGFSSLHGTSMTDLARQITPPVEPSRPQGFGLLWPVFLGIIALCSFVSTSIIAAIIIITKLSSFPSIPLILFWGLLLLAGFFLPTGLIYFIEKRMIRKETSEYKLKFSKWQNSMRKWYRSYYCHRNGIIFDPDYPGTCDPTDLYKFLKS